MGLRLSGGRLGSGRYHCHQGAVRGLGKGEVCFREDSLAASRPMVSRRNLVQAATFLSELPYAIMVPTNSNSLRTNNPQTFCTEGCSLELSKPVLLVFYS